MGKRNERIWHEISSIFNWKDNNKEFDLNIKSIRPSVRNVSLASRYDKTGQDCPSMELFYQI